MKHSLLLGALLAAVPVALLLPGCSGGASGLGSIFPTPTPKPVTTATPTPVSVTQTTNLVLGNGQRAILTTIKNGGNLTGTLQIVPTPVALAKRSAAIPFQFAFGSYVITGTVTEAGAFSIAGNFGAQGAFSMTGQLQSATQDGSYTLKVNGETETGVLPRSGTPFPGATATPAPTSPPSGSYNLTANLTFSNLSGTTDLLATPITGFNDLPNAGTLISTAFQGATIQSATIGGSTGRTSGNGIRRDITLSLTSATDLFSNPKPFSVGQSIPLNATSPLLQFTQISVQGTAFSTVFWRSVSGTAIVRAIGTNSISVELQNVRMNPAFIFGGTGSFTLNGTLAATGLTIRNQ